jgi:hypothetical protein
MIPVEGHKNLYRDENTGAIVNCDTFAYSQYIRMKEDRKKQREEIDQIKSDINEIKTLLKEFLNGPR